MTQKPADRSAPAMMWFRRDLRLADNPALLAALDTAGGAGVLALFVVDPALWDPAGPSRRCYLSASLRSLDASLRSRGGGLVVRAGDPVDVVPEAAHEIGARSVHVAADYGPYGTARDERVEAALEEHGISLQRLGSPYAVAPGRVLNGKGEGYRVFTPFSRAWVEHGWRAPVEAPGEVSREAPGEASGEGSGEVPGKFHWLTLDGSGIPAVEAPAGLSLPEAGEGAAAARWAGFLGDRLADYPTARDEPAVDGTSRMSVHLKWGEIHPRTMLADLARRRSAGAGKYRTELAWREFYADVLWRNPATVRDYLVERFAEMEYDEPGDQLAAWAEGHTGFPIVDAGMRQLRATGWMHNRVRMITASFLVKDLHLEWQHGARHFLRWLVDGDIASNQHGWQWVAGCGTDAAPYFRVFNPTTQGQKFDPDGDYVRRWVPELREVATSYVHEPWRDPAGPPPDYPGPIVDHSAERREALARLGRLKT